MVYLVLSKRAVLQYLHHRLNVCSILAFSGTLSKKNRKSGYCTCFLIKGSSSFVSNYRPICRLNNFSRAFEIVIHDRMSHYFKN
jgi:hypothetical protein